MKTLIAGAFALAVAYASPALADPHDGVWQSNEAKSFWSDGKFPKGFKLKIELKWLPNKLVYHAVNTTVPDKPYINNFEASLDDKVGPLNENARFNEIRIKPLTADAFQVLEQKDGDVIVGQRWEFSKDGKSLVRWGVGKAPDASPRLFWNGLTRSSDIRAAIDPSIFAGRPRFCQAPAALTDQRGDRTTVAPKSATRSS